MKVAVIGGLGHIGLPLSLKLSEMLHEVTIYDTSKQAKEAFLSGKATFSEPGLNDWILRQRRYISLKEGDIDRTDVVIFSTNKENIVELVDSLHISKSTPLIFRQTVRPGDFDQLIKNDWQIAYVPERIAQGRVLVEIDQVPQIIGYDEQSLLARDTTEILFSWVKQILLPINDAIFAKLMCNYFRYGMFALANQLWVAAQLLDVDFSAARDAVMQDYDRMEMFPHAGWSGGFCLPKDTKYLDPWAQTMSGAVLVMNEKMFPIALALELKQYSKKQIGILGVSAMKNGDDMRSSLKDALFPILKGYEIEFLWNDPFYQSDPECNSVEEVLMCDVILIGIPHSLFEVYDIFKKETYRNKIIIDPWGAIK